MGIFVFLWKKIVLNDWPRRLSAVFTGLFLYHYISWFSKEANFWWPQTVRIVTYSLLILVLLDLLPWKRKFARMALQFAGIIWYNAAALGYHPVGGISQPGMDVRDILYQNAVQLHPFIWFSLGAWCAYTVTVWWVGARWRIALLTILSIIVLAVRDSFSPVSLWKETAIVIFCCLGLLIVQHFAEFKRRNPSSFADLAKHPLSVVFPAVILLGMTIIPGLFVSNVAPTVKDPYSLYVQWKGKDDASLLGEPDALAAILQETTSSGYGRGDSNLGGGFNFDYTPVMEVTTTRRSYWRGETRSVYTGSGWAPEKLETIQPDVLNKALQDDGRFPSNKGKTAEVRQTFRILGDGSYPVLFGAFAIKRLESVDEQAASRGMLQWVLKRSELRWSGKDKTAYPKTYTVVSEIPVTEEDELRKAPAELPNRLLQDYLQLPKDLPVRVKQLAQEITGDAPTPYDKAKAIEQYLRKEYPYTNKPDDSKGQSDDFVDRFLFEVREGYCDYYSTAMVVLTRASGIPARWVKGYVSGSFNGEQHLGGAQNADAAAVSDGVGTYTVRNSDAHSWVEVYLTGYGWIPFEPTSGFALPTVEPSAKAQDAPNAAEAPKSTPEPSQAASGNNPAGGIAPGISAGMIETIAGLALAVVLWFGRKRIRKFLMRTLFARETVTENWNHRVIREYNRLLRLYKRKGFTALEHETARETIGRWKEKEILTAEDLDMLLELFEKAKYSPGGVTAEEFNRSVELVEKLRKAV